jgi:predicted  nucleic acid-binding Zn-ribbon protein
MAVTAELLRELHRLHRQLSDLQSRLDRGPKQVKAGEANVARLQEAADQAKEVAKRTEMTAREKERQLKEREGRIEDLKRKLNACSTNREYQAIVEQIAADDQANSVLSDEILELFEKQAAEAEAAKTAAAGVDKGKADLEKLKERIAGEREGLQSEVHRISGELQAAAKNLPGDIRTEYERVAKVSGEEALAPIEDECCGGCYQKITSQMLNELKLQQLVRCKSCGRILYLPE